MSEKTKVPTPAESSTATSLPTIYHSSRIKDRNSVFVAHAISISTKKNVENFKNILELEEKNATNYILAFRMENVDGTLVEESDDDGERYAGERLLNLLKTLDVKNVAVIVTRWFGGVLLGPVRFEHILKCAREVLDHGAFVGNRNMLSSIKHSSATLL
ncbi:8499_t:CDS:2, partial [Acaulospora morrowiae]